MSSDPATSHHDITLTDQSRIAVMGAGAAGSLFSYFALSLAERAGLELALDLYEPRDYSVKGPSGCNMCGGIISETLVQMLATEGINLPSNVVQRGIDGYVLHTDVGSIRIDTPLHEKRIAAVHRGAGPRDAPDRPWRSFDGYLLELAAQVGANVIHDAITGVDRDLGRPRVTTKGGSVATYDLLVVATGVNTSVLKSMHSASEGFKAPVTTKTMIREYHLGAEAVDRRLGDAMHLYLVRMPRLKFAAVIPKGDCASLCLMGQDVDKQLLERFLQIPQVRDRVSDGDGTPTQACGCAPRMNVGGAEKPYADRIVFIGDSGVSRLYKDGIGAAYKTAKAAAVTAVFHGVGEEDFAKHYTPACRALAIDNRFGQIVFLVTKFIQNSRSAQRGVLRMVAAEQDLPGDRRRMSTVLWDTFTGSESYRSIFFRTLHPAFLLSLARHLIGAVLRPRQQVDGKKSESSLRS